MATPVRTPTIEPAAERVKALARGETKYPKDVVIVPAGSPGLLDAIERYSVKEGRPLVIAAPDGSDRMIAPVPRRSLSRGIFFRALKHLH